MLIRYLKLYIERLKIVRTNVRPQSYTYIYIYVQQSILVDLSIAQKQFRKKFDSKYYPYYSLNINGNDTNTCEKYNTTREEGIISISHL